LAERLEYAKMSDDLIGRDVSQSLLRGRGVNRAYVGSIRIRCEEGAYFSTYIRVADICEKCGTLILRELLRVMEQRLDLSPLAFSHTELCSSLAPTGPARSNSRRLSQQKLSNFLRHAVLYGFILSAKDRFKASD
jgi:hypothetical protein